MRRARHLERTADAVRGMASVVFKPSISVNKPVILLHLKSDTLSKTEMFFQAMSLLPLPFRPRLHHGALGPPNRESLKIQDLTLDRRGSGSTVSRSKMVGASQTALASRIRITVHNSGDSQPLECLCESRSIDPEETPGFYIVSPSIPMGPAPYYIDVSKLNTCGFCRLIRWICRQNCRRNHMLGLHNALLGSKHSSCDRNPTRDGCQLFRSV